MMSRPSYQCHVTIETIERPDEVVYLCMSTRTKTTAKIIPTTAVCYYLLVAAVNNNNISVCLRVENILLLL